MDPPGPSPGGRTAIEESAVAAHAANPCHPRKSLPIARRWPPRSKSIDRRLMRPSFTRPDENSLAPWDRRSFFVVCLLQAMRAFSKEAKELATVPNRPFSFPSLPARAPQQPRESRAVCPPQIRARLEIRRLLANLRAWLEFAPSRNPDAFSSHFHTAG